MVLARVCCECALREYDVFEEAYRESDGMSRKASVLFNRAYNFLQKGFEFAFKVASTPSLR